MNTNPKLYKEAHIVRNNLYTELAQICKEIEEADILFHKLVAQAEETIELIETTENELNDMEQKEIQNIFNLKEK